MKPPTRTPARVVAYSILACAALGCLGAVLTSFAGPAGGLVCLGVVACATPFGKVLWP